MIFKGLKYMLLVPFAPMRYFHLFEQEEKSRSIGRWALVWGILIATFFRLVSIQAQGLDLSYGFAAFMNIFARIIIIGIQAIIIVVSSMIMQAGFKRMTFIIPIIAFSTLPAILANVLAVFFPTAMFDIYWIGIIWEVIILVVGINTLGQVSIVKASFIGILSMIALIVFEIYFLRGSYLVIG